MKKVPKPYLYHIIDAVEQIEKYLHQFTFEKFTKDQLTQDATIRQLEIIGEATARLEGQFTKSHPQIPWRDIKDFRNKLIHNYWELNLELIWKAATEEAPELKKALKKVLPNTTLES